MRNFKQFLKEETLQSFNVFSHSIEDGYFTYNFPNKVKTFDCNYLPKLTSLKNCPQEVITKFDCSDTSITSLKYGPIKVDKCYYNCTNTKITSLEYAPLKCSIFSCYGNNIISLKGIGRYYLKDCVRLWLPDSIQSNILGLCKNNDYLSIEIRRKDSVETFSGSLCRAIQIVKKHLDTDGEECMEELIQNGYKDYAKF